MEMWFWPTQQPTGSSESSPVDSKALRSLSFCRRWPVLYLLPVRLLHFRQKWSAVAAGGTVQSFLHTFGLSGATTKRRWNVATRPRGGMDHTRVATPRRAFLPMLWVDIGNRLRETPVMPGEVLNVVLPLAVWIVGWLPNNPHAAAASTLVVTVHIFHTNHYRGSHG